MFILGLAIFLFSAGLVILLLGGTLETFIDIAALLIIFAPLAGILAATQSFKVFAAGLKAAILPKSNIPEDLRGKAASLFRFLSKMTAMIIAVMTLICFVNILHGIDITNYSEFINILGLNIATALITPFWGLILIAGVFEPVVFILKKRYDKDKK